MVLPITHLAYVMHTDFNIVKLFQSHCKFFKGTNVFVTFVIASLFILRFCGKRQYEHYLCEVAVIEDHFLLYNTSVPTLNGELWFLYVVIIITVLKPTFP